jgi:hypothetical protein
LGSKKLRFIEGFFGINFLPLCQAFGQHDICEIHACQCLHSWLSQIFFEEIFSFGEIKIFLNFELLLGQTKLLLASTFLWWSLIFGKRVLLEID